MQITNFIIKQIMDSNGLNGTYCSVTINGKVFDTTFRDCENKYGEFSSIEEFIVLAKGNMETMFDMAKEEVDHVDGK